MRKAAGRAGLCLSAGIACYFLAALVGALIPGSGHRAQGDDTIEIALVRGPIHYDFLIPLTPDARQKLDDLNMAGVPVGHSQSQWLMIGWGARDFYTTTGTYSDVSLRAVIKGLTGDQSVLRVEAFGYLNPDLDLPTIRLSPEQFDKLLTNILDSFARTDQGRLMPMELPGFSDHDQFFEAKGHFNALRTCNVWVGEMLRAADIRFGIWVPLPYSITLSRLIYQSDQH